MCVSSHPFYIGIFSENSGKIGLLVEREREREREREEKSAVKEKKKADEEQKKKVDLEALQFYVHLAWDLRRFSPLMFSERSCLSKKKQSLRASCVDSRTPVHYDPFLCPPVLPSWVR